MANHLIVVSERKITCEWPTIHPIAWACLPFLGSLHIARMNSAGDASNVAL